MFVVVGIVTLAKAGPFLPIFIAIVDFFVFRRVWIGIVPGLDGRRVFNL